MSEGGVRTGPATAPTPDPAPGSGGGRDGSGGASPFEPFDEAGADLFFGRDAETAALAGRIAGGAPVVVVTGPSGVGKTSLVRAGLPRALARENLAALALDAGGPLDEQAGARFVRDKAGAAAPARGAKATATRGLALIIDHVETILAGPAAGAPRPRAAALAALLTRALEEAAGARLPLTVVLVVDSAELPHLPRLALPPALQPGPDAWFSVEPLDRAAVEEVLERTAAEDGAFFEAGLVPLVAADLCGGAGGGAGVGGGAGGGAAAVDAGAGRCWPLELRLAAQALGAARIGSIRKYQASGGVAALRATLFEQACANAGGAVARRALLEVAAHTPAATAATEVSTRAGTPLGATTEALRHLTTAGLLRTVARATPAAGASGGASIEAGASVGDAGVDDARVGDAGVDDISVGADDNDTAYALAHPALGRYIEALGVEDRARAESARRKLRARGAAGKLLGPRELLAVRRALGTALSPSEEALVTRSARRLGIQVALVGALALGVALTVVLDARRTRYVLALDPPRGGAAARVVVHAGRRQRGPARLVGSTGPRGSATIADTGFQAAALVEPAVAAIAAGERGGRLDTGGDAGAPGWLRDVVSSLRPVPRGVAKALLGDPDGITSLKHAFSDPAARRATLDALAVIGRGRAGEDEILAAALADPAPEIRRRGVEVAAAIDCRQGHDDSGSNGNGNSSGGAHAAVLRTAFGDRAPEVRLAALAELETLPSGEASRVLATALRDHDADFRRAAEQATWNLAARHPDAAAAAAEQALSGPDAAGRRAALDLLERIAERAPAASATVLARVVTNTAAPEDARVAALLALRKAGTVGAGADPERPVAKGAAAIANASANANAAASAAAGGGGVPGARTSEASAGVGAGARANDAAAALRPVLEQAVAANASPRLRAAALPLYARLIGPTAAEEIARVEMKGPPLARVSGAAVWGAVAVTRPDVALRPLKALVYDPSPEIRAEAARSFAYLRGAGIPLVDKMLKDPSPEVQRAAIESALTLAPQGPAAVAEMLGKAIKFSRPVVRRQLAEALGKMGTMGKMGEARPALVLGPLGHALNDADPGTRAAAAGALCALAAADAPAVSPAISPAISPYLRRASRDDAREVRAAAASCLGALAAGDPRGAARTAIELAAAPEASVRAAAAASMGRLLLFAPSPAWREPLLQLLGDRDAGVRAAAARSLAPLTAREAHVLMDARNRAFELAVAAAFGKADTATRKVLVGVAAKSDMPDLLARAAGDSDEAVRLEALRAAGGMTVPALAVIRQATGDRSVAVRAEATRLLAGAVGGGGHEALALYEAALRGGDHASREAAVRGLGDVGDGAAAARLLGEALADRSESIRAAAAHALARLADRDPDAALPVLERALHDVSYDVASASVPGVARAWARRRSPAVLADTLIDSESDSARRFAALEALVRRASAATPAPAGAATTAAAGAAVHPGAATAAASATAAAADAAAATAALERVAASGPPLARFAARLGRAFVGAPPDALHTFLEHLLGG